MHSIQVVETFVINWISAKMKFTRGVLSWACYTHHFTQKQSQPQDISFWSLVKPLTVVTHTRQTDKSMVNINLVLRAEVKLNFVTKNSLVNLNHFWLVFSNTHLTTISKYGNDITNSRQKYIWLSGSLKFLCWLNINWEFSQRVFQLNRNQWQV